jgi:serine/threonine protein kinase
MDERDHLRKRIQELTNWQVVKRPLIMTDTSDWIRIHRGCVVRIGGRDFLVEGNQYESRFGIADQPKYWVFDAIDLQTGKKLVLKMVFHEEFNVHIGMVKIHCYRSPEKEAQVLELVRGDPRFMQGDTVPDESGNLVRVLDYIGGPSVFVYVVNIRKRHEQYFHEDLPDILRELTGCMEALQFLHENGTCHGDVRNDHIIIESHTHRYRWIDFDLTQRLTDFDVWGMGNILNYVIGKGINSFHNVLRSDLFPAHVRDSLTGADASAFYEYRIMNLRKLYPYIPPQVNDVLMRFAAGRPSTYATMAELLEDHRRMLNDCFPTA